MPVVMAVSGKPVYMFGRYDFITHVHVYAGIL